MNLKSSYIIFDSAPNLIQCKKESLNHFEKESELNWNLTKSNLNLTSTSTINNINNNNNEVVSNSKLILNKTNSHIIPNPIHFKILKEIRKESSSSYQNIIITQESENSTFNRKEVEGNGIWSDIEDENDSENYERSEEEIVEEIEDDSMDDITDNSIPFPRKL